MNTSMTSNFWSEYAQYSEKWFDSISSEDDRKTRLSKFLSQAEEERRKLELQFNPLSSSKDEKDNRSIISQLENGISAIEKILEQHQQLRSYERKLTIDMKSHEDKAESIAQEFRTTVKRLNNTTRIVDYLHCLETLFKYSDSLKSSLANVPLTESLKIYSNLANLTKQIHDSPVEHLRCYSGKLLVYWYEQLKVLFSSQMKEILQNIEFPYVHKKPESHLTEVFEAHREQLKKILIDLFQVRLVQGVAHVDNTSRLKFIDWKPIPLLVQFLLKDLIMRFNFHFYGKKETNDRRKPEWFLNEIIQWILLHENFLKEKLQPLLDELTEISRIDVKVEFIRGLIELAVVKVDSQLTSILCEKQLFTHYIEEILKFSQRLFEEDIDYPKSLPNCMNLLCEEIIFEKWFQVEQDVAQMKLAKIFKSKSVHDIVYDRLLERTPDDIKLSECAETFLTLIHAMEDRYRLVRYPSRILRLFSLQLCLFYDFLEHLKSSSDEEQNDYDPLSKRFCSILNSIVYVGDVVEKWKINPYYQRLQFFYEQYKEFAEKNGVVFFVGEETSNRIEIDPLVADDFDSIQLNKPVQLVPARILDNLIGLYRDEQEKYVNNIVNHLLRLLKSRSRRYLNEKWTTMPNPKEYFMMNISPSAADVLVELQSIFSTLSMNLVKTVADEIRARIVMEYDEFLFNCIVTDRSFNEGGSAQFLYDFNHGWSRVSNDHIAHLFKKCRESALLLTMSVGSAILLREKLEQDISLSSLTNISSYESEISSPLPSALHEIGVLHLNEFEAHQVLQHRLDLVQR